MALSRSLFCFSPYISSQPAAAAAAIERIKVHLLDSPKPKLRTSLFFKAVPWIPRRFQSRDFSGELLQVAAARSNDPPGHVEDSSRNDSQKILEFNLQNGSASKGKSGNGAVSVDSINMQNQMIPRADSEVGEAIDGDSNDPGKAAKKGRRRKRKKKAPSLLQSESQAEVIVSSADELDDSIVWCTVHLKVQAELEENQRLYAVGANPELGGWDLSQALPLPETDEEGVCENILKIPRGTMLEYKYFTESQDTDSTVIERWFGPEIEYFLPWKEGVGSEVEVIRDTWIPDLPAKLPLLSWGDRWWEEMDSMENDELIDSEKAYNGEDEGLEEPRVEEWFKRKVRNKVLAGAEPSLLESQTIDQRNGSARKKYADVVEGPDGGIESFFAEEKDPEVQVEILINSPQCTMQRMAILEDGKLVELLLEPVNTRVQVGNVYLGVVRQLLPGMTGVFVDIGGFQLALLDITRNQYPYTFPSIGQSIDIPGQEQSWATLDDDEDSDWDDSETGEEEDDDEDDQDSDFDDEEEGDDGELDEELEDDTSRGRSTRSKGRVLDATVEDQEVNEARADSKGTEIHSLARAASGSPAGPITVNFGRKFKKWRKLQEGMQIIVQVKKEALGKKGPRLTAFPSLAGRFWILIPGGNAVGVSRRITGPERKRLRQLAQDLLPPNFSLTVRTESLGHGKEELEKDLARLMETWKEVLERASAAAVAAEHGMEGAMPVLLHRAMGQFLTIVRDFFNDKVHRMVIDSPQCYQEVTSYLQEVAPHLSDRVELYTDKTPIFDAFDIESEIEKFSDRRVSLPTGGYLVMEETEALVSIDVNGGTGVLSHDISQEEAILAVNLAAARQIAAELRLRDIGGIIVVDFIDMEDPKSEKMVLEEMQKAIARDRSSPSLSEISEFGLMELTRKRVRPSVTLTISNPCSHCVGAGRVEAYETTLSKIERAVLRLLTTRSGDSNSLDSTKWPQYILRVDNDMGEYLKARKRKRMTQLSAALKVWLNLKVALDFTTGQFQVFEQHKIGIEKRPNGAAQIKSNQPNVGPDLLGKKGMWPGKRRRNFANFH
ncbi:unnamed protein product [Calypogeia fissa]